MEISVQKGDVLASQGDLLVVGAYEGNDWQNAFMVHLDELLGGKFNKLAKAQEFEGKVGQSILFPAPDAMQVGYVLVVGLGKQGERLLDAAREAAGLAVQTIKQLGLKNMAVEMFGEDDEVNFIARDFGQAVAEAMLLADYSFQTYKKKAKKSSLKSITIVAENGRDANAAARGVEKAEVIFRGVKLARDIVNTPAQDMKPRTLTEIASEIAKESKGCIKVKVFDREQCAKKKMGLFLAVAQGADEEPQFIHLTYKPERGKKKIAVVGKGITFDSGGLSLKPADYMQNMKCDMAGAAAVLGLFRTLAELRPKMEVHGIIAATENVPSARATKPGDIARAANGKSVEILNTDAEGRLALADSLIYAAKQEPDAIVDLATLTGACLIALGEEVAGLMGNNAKFANEVLNAAAAAGEKLWEMPLEQRYVKLLESDVADLRNIATTRYGGSLTAGLFLQQFVDKATPWAHLDIAGPAFAERPLSSYIGKGGSGFGVRTLINLIESR